MVPVALTLLKWTPDMPNSMTVATPFDVCQSIIDEMVDARCKVPSIQSYLADIRAMLEQQNTHKTDRVFRFTGPDSMPITTLKGRKTAKRFQVVVTQFEHNGRYEVLAYAS